MNWIKIRRWTWELPQSLIGALLVLFFRGRLLRVVFYRDQKVYIYDGFPGGISLGYYILVDYNRTSKSDSGREKLQLNIKHESGHGVQSARFGWLYLPLPGLLSLAHNVICKIKGKLGKEYNYYRFFVERSADKLGGINRD